MQPNRNVLKQDLLEGIEITSSEDHQEKTVAP